MHTLRKVSKKRISHQYNYHVMITCYITRTHFIIKFWLLHQQETTALIKERQTFEPYMLTDNIIFTQYLQNK
jgi:hypothetical protein